MALSVPFVDIASVKVTIVFGIICSGGNDLEQQISFLAFLMILLQLCNEASYEAYLYIFFSLVAIEALTTFGQKIMEYSV